MSAHVRIYILPVKMNMLMFVKQSCSLRSFLFSRWSWCSSCALDVTLISALGNGLATSLQRARCSLERRHKVIPSCCWSSHWASGLRVKPWSSLLYSILGITHRMGYTDITCILPTDCAVFTGRVCLAARSGSLSCARGVGKKGIQIGYLDQTPVYRTVLSPQKSKANCYWGGNMR